MLLAYGEILLSFKKNILSTFINTLGPYLSFEPSLCTQIHYKYFWMSLTNWTKYLLWPHCVPVALNSFLYYAICHNLGFGYLSNPSLFVNLCLISLFVIICLLQFSDVVGMYLTFHTEEFSIQELYFSCLVHMYICRWWNTFRSVNFFLLKIA